MACSTPRRPSTTAAPRDPPPRRPATSKSIRARWDMPASSRSTSSCVTEHCRLCLSAGRVLLTGWGWDADCLLCVLVGAMCVVPLLGDISDGAACQGSINHDHNQLDLRHRHLALRTRAAGARANPARQPSPLQRRECRAQDALGFGLFLIFAGFCAVMAGFTAAFVPETRGVSIDAITQLWSRNVPSGKGNTLQQPLRS